VVQEVKLDTPYGDELPEKGFDPGEDTFQAPPKERKGLSVRDCLSYPALLLGALLQLFVQSFAASGCGISWLSLAGARCVQVKAGVYRFAAR
jgi:hypothetical protein